MFELQATVLSIIIITILLIVFLVILNGKLKKFDPMDEPKGLVLLAMVATQMVDKNVREKTNDKVAKYLTPYIMTVVMYIFMANISGLLSLEAPTSNYSVTLVLAAITCVLIEVYSAKARGAKGYIKSWFEPFAPFVVLNVFSRISTLLSLSLRLFGNILSGGILMSVIYQMLSAISSKIPVIGQLNIAGILVAPVLHFYFDLFSGAMQAFIFMTLTISFIGKELPEK
ncbi:MAG: F0F1 ATP synthase subunit A [Erysipelotrichaceae bacterium]|nr:F0F1 ATP synthase subunit A [Erysipelotrichaceae bacterium]MBR2545316.1 F0F1 ATP synthase subunit A [Erysipelotrichaceae bacterium]MBR2746269.1 F0F1 ATP synthase subunit A [Erysipelotrichaceae bacterium]